MLPQCSKDQQSLHISSDDLFSALLSHTYQDALKRKEKATNLCSMIIHYTKMGINNAWKFYYIFLIISLSQSEETISHLARSPQTSNPLKNLSCIRT